jgi:predicted esterase
VSLVTDKQLLSVREKFMNMRYLLYVPDDYAQDTVIKWPLLIFLHGSQEMGSDLLKVTQNGPPKLVREGKKFPFIIVSPQLNFGQFWDPELIYILVKKISRAYRVDEDRIYLTGLSMGGFGTWFTALTYPQLYAAIVPVCGGGNPKEAWKIRHLPVWIFHGAKDHTVSLSRSANMAAALLQFNNAKFTIYPDAEHDSWTETYSNDSLYTWLLSHKRFSFKEYPLSIPSGNITGQFTSGHKILQIILIDGKLFLKEDDVNNVKVELHYSGDNSFYFNENSLKEIRFNLDRNGKMTSFIFYNETPVTYFRVR